MGAISFSLDEKLVDLLRKSLDFSVFVETGTFNGDTLASLHGKFGSLYSVELSPDLFKVASSRLSRHSHIHLFNKESARFLLDIKATYAQKSVLFWLDAHWCVADLTSGEQSQCPLLSELDAIGHLNEASVILIDDARYFLAPPPAPHDVTHWPTLNDILTKLRILSDKHSVMVINDVIAFFPSAASDAIHCYAREFGVDWLLIAHRYREHAGLVEQLNEKEAALQRLHREHNAATATVSPEIGSEAAGAYRGSIVKTLRLKTRSMRRVLKRLLRL